MTTPAPKLYQQFFIDKGDERIDLFRTTARHYGITTALYAGSFVQISPSFVIPNVTYVDSDRRIPRFFSDPQLLDYVKTRREYQEEPRISFHHCSYESDFDEPVEGSDLLISQFAGFISPACKRYLKVGGVLLVNDSHGDASMANINQDFQLIGTVTRDSDQFHLSVSALDEFFIPKGKVEPSVATLRERGRGFNYTQSADNYIFRKIR